MSTSARLFIAAELPPPFIRELETFVTKLKMAVPGKYVPSSNYHVTLAFLGETGFDEVERISSIIAAGTAGGAGRVTLDVPGIFGNPENAILWCGLQGTARLLEIAQDIRTRLERAAIAFDTKPVRPHITLARKARTAGVSLPIPQPLSGDIPAVTLFESKRINGMLTYLPIYRAKF